SPPSDPPKPQSRPALRLALVLLAALVAIAIGAAVLLEFPAGVRWAAQLTMDAARPLPGASLRVGGASGGFLTGIELHDIRVIRGDGVMRLRLDTLRVTYRPLELLKRPMTVRWLELGGPSVEVTPGPATQHLRSERRPAHQRFELDLAHLTVRGGSMAFAPPDSGSGTSARWRARGLAAEVRDLKLRGADLSLALESLSTEVRWDAAASRALLSASGGLEPGLAHDIHVRVDADSSHLEVTGSLALPRPGEAVRSPTALRIRFAPLAGVDLRRLLPALKRAPDVSLEAELGRADDSVTFTASARAGDGGQLESEGQLRLSQAGPSSVRMSTTVSGVDPGAWSELDRGALRISGTLGATLSGSDAARLNGPVELSIDAQPTGAAVPRAHAQLSARFTEGLAAVNARAAIDAFEFHGAGSVRPFGTQVSCDLDLAADVPPVRPPRRPAGQHGAALVAGRLIGSVRAEVKPGTPASGAAVFTFEPDDSRHSVIGPGRIEASLAERKLRWAMRAAVESGELSANGEVEDGAAQRYSVGSGEARAVPLGALLGDSVATELDATFSWEGRGFSAANARIEGVIAPLAIRRGHDEVRLDSLRLSLHDQRIEARVLGTVDGASLAGRAWVRPATPPYRASGFALEFHGLDGARFSADTLWGSELSGTLDGELSAPDLREWVAPLQMSKTHARESRGSFHLSLSPSQWRHQRIAVLSFDANWSGSLLGYRGRLESSFGRAQWTGEARPFDPTPAARLTSLTLEDVDLSRLLGRPELRSRIGGRLTAEGAGASLDSVDGRWGLALDGSSLGTLRLGRLRCSGNLVRGALDARIEADGDQDSLLAQFAGMAGFGAHGQGPNASGRIQGGVRFGGVRADTVSGEFSLADGVLRLPWLVLHSNVLEVSARGRVVLARGHSRDSTDLQVTGSTRDLRPLGARLKLTPLEAGTGVFMLSAHGNPDALSLSASATATRVRAGTTRADSLEVSANGMVRGDSLVRLDARADVRALVPLGLEERDLSAHARWDGRELALDADAALVAGSTETVSLRAERRPGGARVSLDGFEMGGARTRFMLE
ncbi:MAG: hypothetical protein ACRENS_08830, partial [Candidatus Eiseniibacteriota bacterium]